MKIPACPYCGKDKRRAGGGTASFLRVVRHETCESCGALFTLLTQAGCALVAVTQTEKQLEALVSWINDVLDPTFEAYREELCAARTNRFESWLCSDFITKHPNDSPYLKDRSFVLSSEGRKSVDAYHAQAFKAHPEDPQKPYPPKVPEIPYVFVPSQRTRGLRLIDRARSATLLAPEHPRIRKDREYWRSVCDAVRASVPAPPFSDWRPIENQYERSNRAPPWYRFRHENNEVTVGYRHRVASLQISVGGAREDRVASALKALALRDDVTFWHDDESIGIHAWTREKAVEYLCAMLRAASQENA